MKAIVTKRIPATDRRPVRIAATCGDSLPCARIVMSLNAAEDAARDLDLRNDTPPDAWAHAAVAVTLAKRNGWRGRLAGGSIAERNEMIFVWVVDGDLFSVGREENEYGLTLEEWRGAADYGCADKVPESVARKAWKAGEDPTEHAARSNAKRAKQ